MAGLHFDITGDNTNLMEKLKEVERGVKSASASVEKEGGSIEQLFSRMSKAAAAFGAGFTAKELIQNIVQVRGEFQQLEVAFTTMLGSQEKATSLMSQLTETAAKTPFDLQGVANGARQLLAYGTAAEDVNETLVRLGNIAAGLSIPLNDLVYLYGTTMTQGRLYTQDLNQFTGRGIPMIKELAKEFGVAESEIKSMVEAGKIGFPEVQKVIQNLTDEGGMFYNLMQEQSKTITGQISNIGDSFSMMLNEIGKANEGIINDALGGVSYLIESYETVGKTLLEIVGTYGAYKAALITITALQKAYSAILAQSALNQSLAAASGVTLSNAQALAATRTKLLQMAQAALNKTLLANPYALVAAAVAALGVGLYKLVTYQTEAEKAQERLNDAVGRVEGAASSEMAALRELNKELTEAEKGSDEWYAVKEKIVNGYSKYLNGIDEEIERTGSLAGQYENLQKAIRKSIAARSYSNFAQQEEEKYNSVREENLKKAYEYLTKTYGDEKGLNFYRGWLNWVDKEEDTPAAVQKAYEKGGLNELLQEIRNQDKIRKQKLQEYLNMYEIPEPEPAQSSQAPFSAEGKSISQLEEEIGKAQTKLESLKKAFADGSGTKEAVSEQEAYIKSLQDTVLEREKDLKVINEVEAQISKLKKAQKETAYGSEEYNSLQSRINTLNTKLPPTKAQSSEANKAKEAQQKLADELLQLRLKNQQDEINLMKEGSEKKRKQIELDYKTELAEIRRLEKEWSEKNGGKLTDEQAVQISIRYGNAENKRDNDLSNIYKEDKEKLESVLSNYQDFAAQREAIEKQFNDDIAYLQSQRTEENAENIDRAIKVAKEKRKEALKELSDEEARLLTGNSGFFSRLFSDSSAMTRASLKKVIREAKELTDYLNGFSNKKLAGYSDDQLESLKGNAESIKGIYDALIEKQDELDRRTDYPFNGIVKGFEKLKESSELANKALKETDTQKKNILQGQSEAAYGKGVDYLREGAVEASDAVGYLSEQMSALADATGNAKFKEFSDQFSAFSQNLQAAGQGAQSGGWIGAIVGGASDMINQTFAAFAQVKAEEYEFEQNRIDFLQELERLSVTLKEEDYDSIFGVNSIEKAREAYVLALEALRKYEEAVSERTMPEIEKEYKNLGAAIFSGGLLGFGFGKRISEETKTLLKAYEKGYTDLQAMAVKTKDRSGWANFWGKKDEYTALKDLAPQLWDDDGSFNIDAAEAFLETNTQINDEQRKQIQNVIDLKKAYDENISVIDEMISSTFGNLSEDITDAIFDSVRNGADAWSLFEEAGSEVIDKLGRQLVQQMYVQSYLDTFTERMRAAYGLDSMQDTQEELASIMKDIFSGLGTVLEGASSAAEDWDKMAEEYGFSIDKETPEQQSASSGGYETMTQDQASELSGRFTALYEVGIQIYNTLQLLQTMTVSVNEQYSILSEIRNLILSSNGYLEDIAGFQKKIWEKVDSRLDSINNVLNSKL